MPANDPLEDLLEELDSHGDLSTSQQVLRIRMESRRYGKPVTIVEGFDLPTDEVEHVASELKRSIGTGGTTVENRIELQGEHRDALPSLLRERGFDVRE